MHHLAYGVILLRFRRRLRRDRLVNVRIERHPRLVDARDARALELFPHFSLDEIYAVEFKTGRWRTKKSFGTAMKLWGGNSRSNFAAYAKLAIVGMGVVGEPNIFKQFAANQPELANRLNDAINIVSTLGNNDPQLTSQVNQLKNILGTLNPNTANQFPPQNGGSWPSTAAFPTSPPNNQYPYSAPTNASASIRSSCCEQS